MRADYYAAVIVDCSIYCCVCSPVPDSDPESCPIFAGDEWDYPPSCKVCGTEHDYMVLLEPDGPDDQDDNEPEADEADEDEEPTP